MTISRAVLLDELVCERFGPTSSPVLAPARLADTPHAITERRRVLSEALDGVALVVVDGRAA